MKTSEYLGIKRAIESFVGTDFECVLYLRRIFWKTQLSTLSSIKATDGSRNAMKNLRSVRLRKEQIYNIYLERSQSETPGTLIALASELKIPLAMLADIILTEYSSRYSHCRLRTSDVRKVVKNQLADSSRIPDGFLAMEVLSCVLGDYSAGPVSDLLKKFIKAPNSNKRFCDLLNCLFREVGKKYEDILTKWAKENNLIFKTENNLRTEGYDKTPDILLLVPASVDGFIINWIESKATFADGRTHGTFLSQQYKRYHNRFGSGLVIYWFGYVESIKFWKTVSYIKVTDRLPNISPFNPLKAW